MLSACSECQLCKTSDIVHTEVTVGEARHSRRRGATRATGHFCKTLKNGSMCSIPLLDCRHCEGHYQSFQYMYEYRKEMFDGIKTVDGCAAKLSGLQDYRISP